MLSSLTGGRAGAEVNAIRLARQTSMGYMQFSIMDHDKPIEKYAKAAGLGDGKVAWDTFNDPINMNDALLASDWLYDKILSSPQVQYTLAPQNTMKYADFMHKVGSTKRKPASGKVLFFPEIHDIFSS